jgi:excisionase family DNA binding protein
MTPSRASKQVSADPDARRLREHARLLTAAAQSAKTEDPPPSVAALGLDDVVLPPNVLEAAAEVLREQARGQEPEIIVVRENVSTQQAADLLGVSRPHLAMLLDRERIPYETTAGGHRRIRLADIEDYRNRQELAQTAIHDAMASAEQLADDDQ